jgi:Ran GTPase-activating protein (RanGAP) involved in mRNA processing and transport
VRDGGCALLGEALVLNESLTLLDLTDNHISPAGAEALCKGLRNNYKYKKRRGWSPEGNATLRELALGHNDLGDAGARAAAELLKANGQLEILHLHFNHITDKVQSSFIL